jgi:hypothetical protein
MAASFVLAGGLREQQIGHPVKHDQSVVGRVELSGPVRGRPSRDLGGALPLCTRPRPAS